MTSMESIGPHRKGDSSAPLPDGVDCGLPGPLSDHHHPINNSQSARAVDHRNTTDTACSPTHPVVPRRWCTDMLPPCRVKGRLTRCVQHKDTSSVQTHHALMMLLFSLPPSREVSPSRPGAGFSWRSDKANWMPSRSYERTFTLFWQQDIDRLLCFSRSSISKVFCIVPSLTYP